MLHSAPHALGLTLRAVRSEELSGPAAAVLQAGVEVPRQQRLVQRGVGRDLGGGEGGILDSVYPDTPIVLPTVVLAVCWDLGRERTAGHILQTGWPVSPLIITLGTTKYFKCRLLPVSLPEHGVARPNLPSALVLLPGGDRGPGGGDLHQVGPLRDGEGLHTVSDLTAGQAGVRPPLFVPQTPRTVMKCQDREMCLNVSLCALPR